MLNKGLVDGDQKMNNALNANGMAAHFINGIRRPSLCLHLSLNPATTLGIADKKGSLEVGKDADIIITDEKFDVLKTIIGGEIKYES